MLPIIDALADFWNYYKRRKTTDDFIKDPDGYWLEILP